MLAPVPAANKSVSNWEDVLGLIRARSTELRIAYAAVERAEGQSRIALAGALPSLNGTGTLRKELLTRTTTNQFTTPTGTIVQRVETPSPDVVGIAALTLSQPIFAPRAWYGIKTAHMGEDVARMSVEQTKRGIAANVASTVLAVVTAERVAELNRIGLRAALERLDLAARKRALGAATGLDVLRAQQDVEAARATLVSGDESLRQQREALGLALGLSEAVGVSANISLDGMQQTANQICKPAGSIDERADVAVARGQTELANRGVGDVKWQFSPTINAQSTLATTSVASNVAPATTWNIQGVLTIPFWEGGARYGLLRQAESEVDRTENLLVQTRRSVTIEIAQAIRAVSVAESARNVAADARKLAAEVDRLTQAGYLEGQGTSLELVIAAQALRQADITLALREFELVRAHILAILSQANCPF
jgi:outer membrane protein TolC